MLEHVYDIETVREFLRKRDARRLDDDDPALPTGVRAAGGESWFLPVGWRHAANIVVHFGPTYPDDPPLLFFPASSESRELLPHVSDSGDICTVVRTNVVNPQRAQELLEICLRSAETTLDREWTDDEMTPQINDELAAYWALSATDTLLYAGAELRGDPLEVATWPINRKYSIATPATAPKLVAPFQLAMVVELGENETVPFLRDQGPYLSASNAFRATLGSFAQSIYKRTERVRGFDLFLFLVVKHAGGETVLAGRLRQSIKAKGKSAAGLCDAVVGALSTKGLQPWNAEDISTPRLLRRTMGPYFDPEVLERRVAIVGCGSLGGTVADGLARSGVRRFLFCDAEILKPENLLRHLLPADYLGIGKACGLRKFLLKRLPDAQIDVVGRDIRTNVALTELAAFAPDLVLFATGDTNTDLTMSLAWPLVHPSALAFAWADADLKAGHMIYQPVGAKSRLLELHDEKTMNYVHSLADSSIPMPREAGCQGSYSPYSGLAMSHFACVVAMKALEWLRQAPLEGLVLRMPESVTWDRLSWPNDAQK